MEPNQNNNEVVELEKIKVKLELYLLQHEKNKSDYKKLIKYASTVKLLKELNAIQWVTDRSLTFPF